MFCFEKIVTAIEEENESDKYEDVNNRKDKFVNKTIPNKDFLDVEVHYNDFSMEQSYDAIDNQHSPIVQIILVPLIVRKHAGVVQIRPVNSRVTSAASTSAFDHVAINMACRRMQVRR